MDPLPEQEESKRGQICEVIKSEDQSRLELWVITIGGCFN